MKKKILVTGATGFIGANLIRHGLDAGQNIHILMRRGANVWRIKEVLPRVNTHVVDMRDAKEVAEAVRRIRPQYIFHLASYGAYPFQADVAEMVRTDIGGTLALLQATRNIDGLEAVISAGSSTEYGFKDHPMQESDMVEPNTAYGAAKASQTLWSQFFAISYGLPVVVIRPSLVYGSYEEPTRLIPSAIVAHIRNKPLSLSSPFPKKDFVFIGDVLDACDVLARNAKKYAGEIFNVASGNEYSVGEVVMLVRRLMKRTVPFQWGGHEGRIWDTDTHWVDDVSKAKKYMKWQAKHTFEDGLTKTIRWFEKYHTLYP